MNTELRRKLFDLWAFSYDWLFPSIFYQAVHKRLLEYVELPDSANILDLGCGTGRLLNRLAKINPNLRGTGLDFSTQMLIQARQSNQHHPRLIFVQGTAQDLPFAEEQFNAVFSTFSFLHYPQPQQVFAEIHRILQPQSRFYWVDPVSWPSWGQANRIFYLYNSRAREELGQQAKLTCLGHYFLLSTVLLSVFEK